ncbi:3-oxoacyl-[acyl-carrier-protein] synthase 2 [Polystyrenella longa]|uniref:3-oxoacyl-[acyl-carrier-protein] synthase 2 n=1 Tax=Polystyrenella longa TaxID=2528007 RepID=A0A518CL94_9PLAN|nr:beta-ketoacyl-[acyl-carrier-protein] synthase family protein [Polystyrenella longa]QDU79944.1 3-oxoacyl-[acyl-carrier-protein] synthase 2 [Polystyrenella longa]
MRSNGTSDSRIVITGIGVVTPLGIGMEPFSTAVMNQQSGVKPLELLSTSAAPGNIGGEVSDFTEKDARKTYLKPLKKSVKVMCREIQLGVAAALQAVENSGLDLDQIDHTRFGVEFGANLMFSPPWVLSDACVKCCKETEDGLEFQFDEWGEKGLAAMEPLWLLCYLPNMPACHIGISMDARGPSNSMTVDEASGNLVLGEAMSIIERGWADIMIAGTTGTRLNPVKSIHGTFWDDLAQNPDTPSSWARPFDKDRNGQVLAEGGTSFILETEKHAQARGAKIWATLLGSGASCVADDKGQGHYREALVRAMTGALHSTGLKPSDIGHINANGLGEVEADREEAQAIHDVFGDIASQVPVTSFKSYWGNPGASCGSLELAGSLVGLQEGVILPTLNFTAQSPEDPSLNIVHGAPLATDNKVVMNINVTRQGQASVIIAQGA